METYANFVRTINNNRYMQTKEMLSSLADQVDAKKKGLAAAREELRNSVIAFVTENGTVDINVPDGDDGEDAARNAAMEVGEEVQFFDQEKDRLSYGFLGKVTPADGIAVADVFEVGDDGKFTGRTVKVEIGDIQNPEVVADFIEEN